MIATTSDAYKLLHDGCVALSQVEANGMRVDTDYLDKAIAETTEKISDLTNKLKSDAIYKVWKKQYGIKTNLDSGDQLGNILFKKMKYKSVSKTETGKPKTDISALEKLDIPFVKSLLEIKKLKKAKSTYLLGIKKETVDGFLHPVFNLHLVQTFRSSSDSPNFQNMPIRDPMMGELIRRCFIPRKGRRIVEADYSQLEVHGACWYHKDPVMMDYLADKTKDMHRDVAVQAYMLSKKELLNPTDKTDEKRIKAIRFCGKSHFVFPEFYGDWFMSCAPSLWNAIDKMKLHLRDGTSLKDNLKKKGISRLGSTDVDSKPLPGTFVHHIKEVEFDFWNNRFRVYKEWRDDWFKKYTQTGMVKTLTGFEIAGLYKRNEIINYPVQGVAFHCLLWSLIRLQKLLRKYKMKSLIVGQIHDSIVSDVVDAELKDYTQLIQQVMVVDIKKHWDWIITPIEVEIEATPVDKSWWTKEKVEI